MIPGKIPTNDLALETLQQRLKDRVLQIRRPDSSAERPYDEVPVPALEDPGNIEPGLQYRVFEAATPWVPDVHTLEESPVQSGITEEFDLEVRTRDKHIVLEYAGLLEVPETGTYTFSLQADRGAVLRIHDAMVIDADKDSGSAITSEIRLEEGYRSACLCTRGRKGCSLSSATVEGTGVFPTTY